MAPMHRLQIDHVKAGAPLPFDVYDDAGHLLLKRGLKVLSDLQLERLIERGLFCTEPDAVTHGLHERQGGRPGYVGPKSRKVSVMKLLTDIQGDLEVLLTQHQPENFAEQIQELVKRLQHACTLDADAAVASMLMLTRGNYSVRRMVHTALLSELLMRQMAAPDPVRAVTGAAALTMNLSMLELQDTLYAQQSPPDESQSAALKRHPQEAVDHLRALGVNDSTWHKLVLQHHETIDGRGYPAGLKGQEINKAAQVISLADRYGAMVTGRAYRAAMQPNMVLKTIYKDQGVSVDALLVSHLIKAVGIYPPGCAVALANGDLAIVIKRTQSANQPVVRCVKNAMGKVLSPPPKRLTSEPAFTVQKSIARQDLGCDIDTDQLWGEAFEFVVPASNPEAVIVP